MKYCFYIMMMCSAVLANWIELYRTQGVEAVQYELDKALKQRAYWNEYLKNKNTQYGYYESIQYLAFTQKIPQTMQLYQLKNDQYELLMREDVFVGQARGDKQKEGDLKTPMGAYALTKKLSNLDQFYGPLALVIDYPNQWDKSLNKTGHGIWIHGLPFETQRKDYTRGCIALENDRLIQFDEMINIQHSALIISDQTIQPVPKGDLVNILSSIYSWKDAWTRSDLEDYMTFYDRRFQKSNGMRFNRFERYKERIFAKKERKIIQFKNINIMPYPNPENRTIYKLIMDQDYRTRSYTFTGKKELYVELQNNQMKILVES